MRGIAAGLVIVGHALQYGNKNFDGIWLYKFIYSFHMPLFFFISGYCANHAGAIVPKIAKQLLLPFIAWGLIYTLPELLSGPTISAIDVIRASYKIFLDPDDYGLWFLWVLFLCSAFEAYVPESKKIFITFLFVLLLYIIEVVMTPGNFFGIGLFRWYLPFYIFGYWCRKNNICISQNTSMALAAVGLILLTQWSRTRVDQLFFISISSEVIAIFATLAIKAAVGVCFILAIFGTRARLPSGSVIASLSQNSLGFYATQFLFLSYVAVTVNESTLRIGPIASACMTSIIVAIASMFTIVLVKKSNATSVLLLGKRIHPKVATA